jgi:hypothetical protein
VIATPRRHGKVVGESEPLCPHELTQFRRDVVVGEDRLWLDPGNLLDPFCCPLDFLRRVDLALHFGCHFGPFRPARFPLPRHLGLSPLDPAIRLRPLDRDRLGRPSIFGLCLIG